MANRGYDVVVDVDAEGDLGHTDLQEDLEFHSSNFEDPQNRNKIAPDTTASFSGSSSRNASGSPKKFLWSIQFYAQFFDVDTNEVIKRCWAALYPRANFLDVLEGNPDLYGPFWIATTVVFILFMTGTISWKLDHRGQEHYSYDFGLLSGAAGLIYGYTGIIPIGLWATLKWFGSESANLMECWALYGYANLIWIPVALISWSPISILNYVFVGIGFLISASFLFRNLYPVLSATDVRTSKILLIVVVALHAGLAIAIKILFFAHKSPAIKAPKETKGDPAASARPTFQTSPCFPFTEVQDLPKFSKTVTPMATKRLEFINVSDPSDAKAAAIRTKVRKHVMKDIGRARRRPKKSPTTFEVIFNPQCQLGSREIDPFVRFPIEMGETERSLLSMIFRDVDCTQYAHRYEWFSVALIDEATMLLVLSNSAAHRDRVNGLPIGQKSPDAHELYLRALESVNRRLLKPEPEISEGLVGAIAGLMTHNDIVGNFEEWTVHVNGLEKLLATRGGINNISTRELKDTILYIELRGAFYQDIIPRFPLSATWVSYTTVEDEYHDEAAIKEEFLRLASLFYLGVLWAKFGVLPLGTAIYSKKLYELHRRHPLFWGELWPFEAWYLLVGAVGSSGEMRHYFFEEIWALCLRDGLSIDEVLVKAKEVMWVEDAKGESIEGGYAALVRARATSNQRLVTVFGIDNAFTTFDSQRKSDLVGEANHKVKNMSDEEWQQLAHRTAYWAASKINSTDTQRLDLTEFAQSLTMKVSLSLLFDLGAELLESEEAEDHIAFIAKEINRLWLASKIDPITEKWEEQSRFHKALHHVTNSSKTRVAECPHFADPKENPLNWILPAYESMWRIVLTTVRQVYFYTDGYESKVMRRFLEEPCRRTFRNEDKVCSTSAHHVIKECLRLYPPIRRIGRTLPENGEAKHIKADIRQCQRNHLLADFEPDEFHPKRWEYIEAQYRDTGDAKSLSDFEEQLGFLPFGSAPFKCPAGKSNFAFRMIGILVGAIIDSMDQANWHEDFDRLHDVLGSSREEENVLLYDFSY
ncbi:hypothetical protein EG328_011679 [Venturia inaequalis]|uniref:Yip1 domain-containing protein n=1 Tax=Venturia inaequalis TaxID=5025 RepID=A0A8H3VH13_VENIN|nr:hypothetical protein EG328_011679 [Venturia inaequalis]